jgi:hypothetical protein
MKDKNSGNGRLATTATSEQYRQAWLKADAALQKLQMLTRVGDKAEISYSFSNKPPDPTLPQTMNEHLLTPCLTNYMTTQTKQARHTPMITLSKGGTKQRTVKLETLHIPDAWGFAFELKKTDAKSGQAIDELWHLAHDLQRHALEQAQVNVDLLEVLQSCENIFKGWVHDANPHHDIEPGESIELDAATSALEMVRNAITRAVGE